MTRSFYLFLCLLFLGMQLSVPAQSGTKGKSDRVNISGTYTIKQIFDVVYDQTGKVIVYGNDLLNDQERLVINAVNLSVEQVLQRVLNGRSLSWRQKEDYYSIYLTEGSINPKGGDSTLTVTGQVTDASGTPLVGATVLVKGTAKGVASDDQGRFVLKGVKEDAVLDVTYTGFLSESIKVSGRKTIGIVSLKEHVGNLDEAVVIAYGTTTGRLAPGNLAIVKAADIQKQPVSNPLLALQGRVPGLFITQSSGFSGAGVKVLIQGQNSIAMGNEPFYVVDGVPYAAQLLPNLGGIVGNSGSNQLTAGNPLNYINPGDIESITVLKDADATAIYGSRAANGAILITTKKGKVGEQRVDINVQQGWGKVTRRIDLLNNKEYLEMRHEALRNDKTSVSPNDYDLNGFWDSTGNRNWQRELIGGTAAYTNVTASVSGGTPLSQYLVGMNYHRESTVFPGDFDDQKGGLHFSINSTSANQKFKFQLTGNYVLDRNEIPNFDLTGIAIRLSPVAPALYTSNGDLNWAPDAIGNSTFQNPLSYLYLKYRNRTSNLVSNAIASYEITKGLELKTSMGYTSLNSRENTRTPILSRLPEVRPNAVRRGSFGTNVMNSWIIEPQLVYKRSISDFKLDLLAGATIQQNKNEGLQQSASGFRSDDAIGDIRSASTVIISSSILTEQKYYALFGRLNVLWRDKLILNLAGRRDGSSRFGPANQFNSFGSAALAWIFSEEQFFKEMLPFITYGKLKGSYGTTGSDQIGDYSFLNTYVNTSVSIPFQGIVGLLPIGLTNPYLEWEETKKINLGLEFALFNDRISLNANYFRNRSSNQLLFYTLPIITGFNGITSNFPATVQNSGFELTLNTSNVKSRRFLWTTHFNLTVPANKLISFPNLASSTYAHRLIVGQPINATRVYHSLGVDPTSGEYIFADKEGNSTTRPDLSQENSKLIAAYPKFYGGIGNFIRYKSFELDFLFQFTIQKGRNIKYGYNMPGIFQGGYGNQPVSVLNRWQKPGDEASHQRYSADYRISEQFGYLQGSDAVYADASYLRLKNISISWQLPRTMLERIHMKNLKVYIQGQNLLTFTKYIGLDPETLSNDNLPPLRVLTAGLQVSL